MARCSTASTARTHPLAQPAPVVPMPHAPTRTMAASAFAPTARCSTVSIVRTLRLVRPVLAAPMPHALIRTVAVSALAPMTRNSTASTARPPALVAWVAACLTLAPDLCRGLCCFGYRHWYRCTCSPTSDSALLADAFRRKWMVHWGMFPTIARALFDRVHEDGRKPAHELDSAP